MLNILSDSMQEKTHRIVENEKNTRRSWNIYTKYSTFDNKLVILNVYMKLCLTNTYFNLK
jgi:hypothetical protein